MNYNKSEGDKMEFEDLLKNYQYLSYLMQPYRSAINIIKAKLESIDDELKCENGHSPIHAIHLRIKSPESIIEKMKRKNFSLDVEGMKNLNDIAGIRVVCHYINDIQYLAQLLIMHEDITLVKKVNYIQYPKESGYRSLHLVVSVPIHLKMGKVEVPVEIQIRTIAMDCWASLEHELTYKNNKPVKLEVHKRLKECAERMAITDAELQKIYQELNN
ncbi:MAG: GTP pyrophosphokinase family protein [Coprobacillus sp.]